VQKIFEKLLELILPQAKSVQEIENLTPAELLKRAGRAQGNLPKDTLAIFDYKNPLMRQAIWELKYRGNKKIAALLADCLYDELAEEISERKAFENFTEPVLISIPISATRRRERGWNQTEILATALLKRGGSGAFFEIDTTILAKIKNTESQTKKNRAERLESLHGCFEINLPEKIAGRNIILLDDVTTTGATFEEARQTLTKAGAKKILAVAVAH